METGTRVNGMFEVVQLLTQPAAKLLWDVCWASSLAGRLRGCFSCGDTDCLLKGRASSCTSILVQNRTTSLQIRQSRKVCPSVSQVPVPVAQINSTEHPVKVGLSDAFMAQVSDTPSGMTLVELQSGDLEDLLGDPVDPHLSVLLSFCLQRGSVRPSLSTTVWKWRPPGSSAGLPSSSPLCPVSIF